MPENTSLFDDQFVEALSYLIAYQIAPRVTAGDPFKLGDRALQFYISTVHKAQATALREGIREIPHEAEHIEGR